MLIIKFWRNAMKFFSICVLTVGLILMGYFVSKGLLGFSSRKSGTVYVKGISERVVKANQAIWKIAFASRGHSFEQARETYMKNVSDIKAFLKNMGFSDSEVSFAAPNNEIEKERDHNGVIKEVTYIIQSRAIVRSEQVDKVEKAAGQVMKLLDKGIVLQDRSGPWNDAINPRFLLGGFDKLRPEMLTEALKSAKAMAQKFAEDGGFKVGRTITADQGTFSIRSDVSDSEPEEGSIHKKVRVVSHLTYALEE
jgi:hypothetical protein